MSDIIFQSIAWHGEDITNEEKVKEYAIKAFGMTRDGQTVSVTIKNFNPYFYVKLENNMTTDSIKKCVDDLIEARTNTWTNKKKVEKSHIANIKTVNAKDFWGFTNNEKSQFAKISFDCNSNMKFVANKFSQGKQKVSGRIVELKCYEHNIDPYIRFIHQNNLEPTEWIIIKKGTYHENTILQTTSDIDIEVSYRDVHKYTLDESAPFLIASFDLECMSLTGDFPVPKKDYKKLASEVHDLYFTILTNLPIPERVYMIQESLLYSLSLQDNDFKYKQFIHKIDPKNKITNADRYVKEIKINAEKMLQIFTSNNISPLETPREMIISKLMQCMDSMKFPELKGDQVIQIGTTFHKYGENKCCEKYIYTLGSCDDIEDATVVTFTNEAELIIKWRDLIVDKNPDIITGYNILGFDFWYLHERALDLGISSKLLSIGRFLDKESKYEERKLSSSALGDNLLKFINMEGRVIIDIMKVVQRDHKLDSYKLDNVASHFIGMQKNDVTPQDIFRLQKGTSADRCVVAKYCIQDCALCNHLMMKLEIIANNIGMSNVCLVPLSFIFMRGQGIKIFSLILKQCNEAGFLIPALKSQLEEEEQIGYEGAIVLDPKEGIYIDEPVTVLDYASLYPSSMISENLSHDCIVLDEKYNNLPGVEYLDISYDIYEGLGDKKIKTGIHTCRFVQGEKGVIPNILNKLLQARKSTRKNMTRKKITMKNNKEYTGFLNKTKTSISSDNKIVNINPSDIVTIEDVYNDFQKAVLDGLQNAYKVTANSLYGQMGARTSQVYMKEIAACTTATGRKMILMAKDFLEKEYGANIVYGDTDSIFCIFPTDAKGREAIMPSIECGVSASNEFKKFIKPPHDLEYEKTFWPFILLSKKRYVGNVYENDDTNFKQKSMGIVLKRRDNAQIVKNVYGGIIDIILNKHDVHESVKFLKKSLDDLISGNVDLNQLIVTKSLRSNYVDPTRIAHKVLADRIRDRDPGNAPQANDRIPYAYIINKNKKCLQGERIEHPDYIKKNDIKLDYEFYITNQIMKPVLQVYGIVVDKLEGNNMTIEKYEKLYEKLLKEYGDEKEAKEKLTSLKELDAKCILFDPILRTLTNYNSNQSEITRFFTVTNKADFKPGDDLDVKTFNTKKRVNKKTTDKKNTQPLENFFKKLSDI
jgi:DNA polymerase elongation subunit (family B)